MKRVLFLSPYPNSVASHRVRIEQYLPALRSAGIDPAVDSLLSERVYRSGGISLAAGLLRAGARRLLRTLAARRYDAVVVHREALPLPTAAIERVLGTLARRLVFDFDDAIYLPQPYSRRPLARFLGSPAKFDAIVAAADRVFAGNDALAQRAVRSARDVRVIPSVVDTDRLRPSGREPGDRIVIGWIGSPSTAHYLEPIVPALREMSRRPGVAVRIVGAELPEGLEGGGESVPWMLEREVAEVQAFDIGLMPLPDDEWARGKCGYKALQYMACAIPTVVSPVGVATQMVEHGRTGLLARTPEEWTRALELLISDRSRRAELGAAARESVVERYSLRAWAPRFIEALSSW